MYKFRSYVYYKHKTYNQLKKQYPGLTYDMVSKTIKFFLRNLFFTMRSHKKIKIDKWFRMKFSPYYKNNNNYNHKILRK